MKLKVIGINLFYTRRLKYNSIRSFDGLQNPDFKIERIITFTYD
jgi:hypothetical protein